MLHIPCTLIHTHIGCLAIYQPDAICGIMICKRYNTFSRCNPHNPKNPKHGVGWPWRPCSDYRYMHMYTLVHVPTHICLTQAPNHRHSGLRRATKEGLMKSKVLCTPAQPPGKLCRPKDKGRHPTCVTLHVHAAFPACTATLWRGRTRLFR